MFKLLGAFVSRFWALIIVAWFSVVVGFLWLTHAKQDVPEHMHFLRALLPEESVLPKWDELTHDGDMAYLPERMTTVRGTKLLEQAFPENTSRSQLALIVAREDGPLTAADVAVLNQLANIDRLAEIYREMARRFRADERELPMVEVWHPETEVVGSKLVSVDRQAALVVVLLSTEFMAVQNLPVLDAVTARLDELRSAPDFPEGLQLGVSGSAAIGGDMLAAARDSISMIDIYSVVLVALILAMVYRAPVLVLIPVTTIFISIVVAINVVSLLVQANQIPGFGWIDFKIFKTTKIFVVTLLFGSGTDFCLFLISRYKEEIQRGLGRREALASSVANVGDAITASALTTVFGLGMMFFADFGKFRNSGPAIALCLLVATLACLTLAPALMRLFSWLIFWPFGVKTTPTAETAEIGELDTTTATGKFWDTASRFIVRRPGLVFIASMVFMSPLAMFGARPHFDEWDGTPGGLFHMPVGTYISYNLVSELSPDRPSVVGTRLLHKHYSPGEVGPVTMLVYQSTADFESPEGEKQIASLTRDLYSVPGVSSVRSRVEPLGDKPGGFRSSRKLAILRNPRVRNAFLSQVPELQGKVTRFDIAVDHDPFSPEAAKTLTAIDNYVVKLSQDKQSPWHGSSFDFLGTTAATRDLKAVNESDQRLIQFLVVIAVLSVLLVMLRRPGISLYLILSVLFSYFVTIGATELLFSWLYQPFEGLDWKVPIFLFVILIAVGQDYNIYLVTRVFEEQKRYGLVEGLRYAVAQTGGIITSCGVIMAGTFVAMLTPAVPWLNPSGGTLKGMLELGFALTLGVLLDTFVVRPILVPAFLAVIYRHREKRLAAETSQAAEIGDALESDLATEAVEPLETISALPHLAAKEAERSGKRRAANQ